MEYIQTTEQKREFIVQLRESEAAEIEHLGPKQIERTYGVRGFSFRRLWRYPRNVKHLDGQFTMAVPQLMWCGSCWRIYLSKKSER